MDDYLDPSMDPTINLADLDLELGQIPDDQEDIFINDLSMLITNKRYELTQFRYMKLWMLDRFPPIRSRLRKLQRKVQSPEGDNGVLFWHEDLSLNKENSLFITKLNLAQKEKDIKEAYYQLKPLIAQCKQEIIDAKIEKRDLVFRKYGEYDEAEDGEGPEFLSDEDGSD